ncbi:formin-like protein 6 [Gracilinanus agilis]|uniref:formin-like protein 6 n=1 Tax=Gracilinanus agilis TaxID=191870 RepID=UPI001CFCBC0F|nr:formin-like protein 6 [Gracilinanus agilis]
MLGTSCGWSQLLEGVSTAVHLGPLPGSKEEVPPPLRPPPLEGPQSDPSRERAASENGPRDSKAPLPEVKLLDSLLKYLNNI